MKLLEVEKAIELLMNNIDIQTEYETVDLIHANNRVLAEDIIAKFSVPSYPKSAMDGYAVISSDLVGVSKETPISLKVLGQINAGDSADYVAKSNTCVRIMTGAEVPKGYDAVIRQEDTDIGKDIVTINASVSQWENYCKIGEDIISGTKIIDQYTLITPMHINLLASLGIANVKVLKPMKVAILSTGSELLEPGEVSNLSRTYNSTVYQIHSILNQYGVNVVTREHRNDVEIDLIEFIEKFKDKVDVIITTGGVSVGDKDLIPVIMKTLNANQLFRGLNLKPGTPVTANVVDKTVVLSCSGNPFACFVNFQVLFWSMLAKKMNCNEFLPKKGYAYIEDAKISAKALKGYIRAKYDSGKVMIEPKGHFSSVMSTALNTNCLVIQPENIEINTGDKVEIQFLK